MILDSKHYTTVETRGYELDRSGRVPPAVLLRYLEHARWQLSTPELELLFRGGRSMVVVAQKLAMSGCELSHGRRLTVDSWFGRQGRSSIDFHQDLRLADTGEAVASARVTAVHIDERRESAALPDAFRELIEVNPKEPAIAVPDSPSDEQLPADCIRLARHIWASDLDLLQHVNHANYLRYFDDARVAAGSALAPDRPLAGAALDYHQQVLLGDEIQVALWVLDQSQLGCALVRADSSVLCRARLVLAG